MKKTKNSKYRKIFFIRNIFFILFLFEIECTQPFKNKKKEEVTKEKKIIEYLKNLDKQKGSSKKKFKNKKEESEYLSKRLPILFNENGTPKEIKNNLEELNSLHLKNIKDKEYSDLKKAIKKQKQILEKKSIYYIKKFPHLSNSCFSNSLLSSLVMLMVSNFGLDEIKKWKKDANYNSEKKEQIEILNAFVDLIIEIYDLNNNSSQVKVETLENLTNAIGKVAPRFLNGEQEDSHEFMMFILASLNEVLSDKPFFSILQTNEFIDLQSKINDSSNSKEQIQQFIEIFKSKLEQYPVYKNLGGLSLNILKFENNDYSKYKLEAIRELPLSIVSRDKKHNYSSVDEIINTFYFEEEEIEESEQYNDPNYGKLINKKENIIVWPKILILKLNRLVPTYNKETKQIENEKFSHLVKYKNYFSPKQTEFQKQKINYVLRSVILHFGGAGGGHYVSYSFDTKTNKWFYFDDINSNTPRIANESEVIDNPHAVMLFYEKIFD